MFESGTDAAASERVQKVGVIASHPATTNVPQAPKSHRCLRVIC
jgi:hypothetical protein